MDIKDRRHRSLTRGRCGKECRYTSSSLDSEDCRVPTQKSYSSSETLKAYDHDTRMHYGNRVSDLVHRESDEFPRQGMCKAQLLFFLVPIIPGTITAVINVYVCMPVALEMLVKWRNDNACNFTFLKQQQGCIFN
ncbi:Teneurin-2 [Platysternon megacephalum]|uniref:Teneurin-2 n=1 Tax=Platysternon megacephalum TaxID=55544 RepID=A0A4D9EDC0_9SAUR|nr:Teneurin-2 [Platysternon megacephalum]